ncbi:hypothetical protein WSM22_30410 [Cytophagales bacterium WSM2-2]|nr:hypothetical protein WSM22_30410 [Cytophagales bacterium WSM2-2]
MKAIVALGLSGLSNSELLIFARYVAACITGQTIFDLPEIIAQIALVLADATELESKMIAPQSEAKIGDIKTARGHLERSVNGLGNLIEKLANGSLIEESKRVSIINLAGMQVKSLNGGKNKRIFAVSHGAENGSVVLTAPAGAVSHEWKYTLDLINFDNKVSLTTTSVGTIEVTGLESGKTYAFFHRSVKSGEVTGWDGPLLIKVR